MHEAERRVQEAAKEYARKSEHKKRIIEMLTKGGFSGSHPSIWFMAGSPGAGKTEVSKELVKRLEAWHQHTVVRIDPDEVRGYLPGYTGGNAHLFQLAVTNIIHAVLGYLLKHGVSFILDGTFANERIAHENIKRALAAKNANVGIYYVHLDPIQAWNFTQKRELAEGRRITKDVFIRQYFAAREVVKNIKVRHGDQVSLVVFNRSLAVQGAEGMVHVQEVSDVAQIDVIAPIPYSKAELTSIISD